MNNEREKLLKEISALCFAVTDLNLYLDSHIESNEIIAKRDAYKQKADELKKEYEEKYGALVSSDLDKNRWSWITSPWPWEIYEGDE